MFPPVSKHVIYLCCLYIISILFGIPSRAQSQCTIECDPTGLCRITEGSTCEFENSEDSSDTNHQRQKRSTGQQATGQNGNNPNLGQAFFERSVSCDNTLRCGRRDASPLQRTTQPTPVKCCILCLRHHPPCVTISYDKSNRECLVWNVRAGIEVFSMRTDYKDCSQIHSGLPRAISGTYPVTDGTETFLVKCEIANNEGWTVLQKRENPTFNFNRSWDQYKWGFGDINADFWMGNEFIHRLTTTGTFRVRFDLQTASGDFFTATYSSFRIKDESDKYKFSVGQQIGGNPGSFIIYEEHLASFSTYDRDNDQDPNNNCALKNGGGWWFGSCSYLCFLNGLFDKSFNCNINEAQMLRRSVMMIKRE